MSENKTIMRLTMPIACAFALAALLVGCSNGIELDRDVEVEDMNFSVPSVYADESDEESSMFIGDDENGIMVSYDDYYDNIDEMREFAENMSESGEIREIDSGVVDGRKFEAYDCGNSINVINYKGPEGGYIVMLVGSQVDLNKFMKSVSFD